MMGFVHFMAGTAGRALRIIAGIILIALGFLVVGGVWGTVLAVVGLVAVAAGVFNFCLLAPVFGASLMAKDLK
jgi:hypothetical protein